MHLVPIKYPKCTNRQVASLSGLYYMHDCGKCPECKEAIRLLCLEMEEMERSRARRVG